MDTSKLHLVKAVSIALAERVLSRENFNVTMFTADEATRAALAGAIADFAEKLCLAADEHKLVVEKKGIEHKIEVVVE